MSLRVGVAGAGVFGTYHAQKAAASPKADLVGVFDVDAARADRVAGQFGRSGYSDYIGFLDDCDAVVVAVPAVHHEKLAAEALKRGKHVLVEKPLSLTGVSARALADLARDKGLVLQVGHQERFVARAMGVFAIPESPLEMESVRVSTPAPDGRAGDVSVVWDLMIHDLDLAACMMGRDFDSVEAIGHRSHTAHLDHAEAQIKFRSGGRARLVASRDAKARQRSMTLVYPSGRIAVDFLTRQVENSTPYPVRVDIAADLPDPLGAADNSFYLACLGEEESFVPGHGVVAAVQMAEAVEARALEALATA